MRGYSRDGVEGTMDWCLERNGEGENSTAIRGRRVRTNRTGDAEWIHAEASGTGSEGAIAVAIWLLSYCALRSHCKSAALLSKDSRKTDVSPGNGWTLSDSRMHSSYKTAIAPMYFTAHLTTTAAYHRFMSARTQTG